jgi:hypothetical protein
MTARSRLFAVAVGLIALSGLAASASAQTTKRPLADWLGPNLAEPIGIIWTEPSNPTWAFIDYFGRNASIVGLNLGSTFEGQVTEKARKDGRADVRVVMHARKVLSYAYDTSIAAYVFGHFASQVATGSDPALADVLLTVDFVNVAPGAPLPSLARLSFFPSPDYALNKLSLVASADGTLRAAYGVPDGTPGRLQLTQRGLYDVSGLPNNGQDNNFPAEHINITVTGD